MITIKQLAASLLCGIASTQFVLAGGTTGACTPPEGKIDIQPDQKCSETQTVGIGKELTLKAVSLKDKDCYCGSAVQDSIDTASGVKWSVGGGMGTFTGGDTNTPKTWKAPATIHTDLAVRLQLDDKATATNTYDDGGFTEVSNLNLDVVKPNSGSSPAATGDLSCPYPDTPSGPTFGSYRYFKTNVARSGCTVDFDGLVINEKGCSGVSDPCGLGYPNSTGSNDSKKDQTLSSNSACCDEVGSCQTSNYTPTASCTVTFTCDWSIKASGGQYIDWGRFNYSRTVPTTGVNYQTNTRSFGQAL